jgi:hypothetical protein
MTADGALITGAEALALTCLSAPIAMVLGAYLLDLAGLGFTPFVMFILTLATCTVAYRWLRQRSDSASGDVLLFLVPFGGFATWLLWLARPTLLPLSTGPDLTHHLILIRYIEEHWRLVHDPAVERFLGEMAQYTPGSHIIAALAGAWARADGLRALHAVQTLAVALEGGFLVLIARRMLPPRAPRVLALAAAILLLAAPRYFLGGFTEYGFVAQVVAQVFVVAMWWAVLAWDQSPDVLRVVVFGLAGAAAFLSWPVYSGPPALALFLVIVLRTQLPVGTRLVHLVAGFAPLALFAGIYLVGRLGWLQLAGTGGAAPWPSLASYSWPLVVLAAIGVGMAAASPRARSTALFLGSVIVQAAVFYLLARRSGAPQPYMALKMFYLLLWPMAACATLAIGELWARAVPARLQRRGAALLAVAFLTIALGMTAAPLFRRPSVLHPLPPAVSLPLYEAGMWARVNVPPQCIEYLVGDDETAYWLHLAVLGNPRMSDRTGNNSTYEPSDAVLRWLTPGGLPFAIADLPALSRDVRQDLDIVQQFGTAAIVKRRGPASCTEQP